MKGSVTSEERPRLAGPPPPAAAEAAEDDGGGGGGGRGGSSAHPFTAITIEDVGSSPAAEAYTRSLLSST